MAGGKGQRLKPLTNKIPKPMIIIDGKPMIQHLIKGFNDQGIKNFTYQLIIYQKK